MPANGPNIEILVNLVRKEVVIKDFDQMLDHGGCEEPTEVVLSTGQLALIVQAAGLLEGDR